MFHLQIHLIKHLTSLYWDLLIFLIQPRLIIRQIFPLQDTGKSGITGLLNGMLPVWWGMSIFIINTAAARGSR